MLSAFRLCVMFGPLGFVAAASPTSAQAATAVGKVTRLVGSAEATTEGATEPLAANAPVHMDDRIATGEAARLEIGFHDGSLLRVGESAIVTIDSFVYQPEGSTNLFKLTIAGSFRFISGKLSKLVGSDVSVATPFALIGVRGTDFWGGPIDGVSGVLLLEGAVSVTNDAGAASLDASGEGTNVAGPDQAPGPVTIWPQEKASRALATVAFP